MPGATRWPIGLTARRHGRSASLLLGLLGMLLLGGCDLRAAAQTDQALARAGYVQLSVNENIIQASGQGRQDHHRRRPLPGSQGQGAWPPPGSGSPPPS